MHDRFAGDRARALDLIAEAFDNPGHSNSAEVVRVAEFDATPAGVIGCYPDWEGSGRGRADVRLGLRRAALARRPLMLAFVLRMRRAIPESPREALYVAALATAPEFRRRGVARALLDAAADEAAAARPDPDLPRDRGGQRPGPASVRELRLPAGSAWAAAARRAALRELRARARGYSPITLITSRFLPAAVELGVEDLPARGRGRACPRSPAAPPGDARAGSSSARHRCPRRRGGGG